MTTYDLILAPHLRTIQNITHPPTHSLQIQSSPDLAPHESAAITLLEKRRICLECKLGLSQPRGRGSATPLWTAPHPLSGQPLKHTIDGSRQYLRAADQQAPPNSWRLAERRGTVVYQIQQDQSKTLAANQVVPPSAWPETQGPEKAGLGGTRCYLAIPSLLEAASSGQQQHRDLAANPAACSVNPSQSFITSHWRCP
jgi:hypothetical protein